MGTLLTVLMILIFATFSFGEDHQTGCIDKFGTKIFELIQNGEYDKIIEQTPSADDFRSIMSNSTFPVEQKQGMISQAENQSNNFANALKKSIDEFKANSNNEEIDWSSYSIDSIEYEHKRKNNIEDVDIDIIAKFNDTLQKISLYDCLKNDGKWLMGNELNWKNHLR